MSKLIVFGCVVALLLPLAGRQGGPFRNCKPVRAYEIRPGVLVMPKYSRAGQLCQAAIQRDHYTNGVVDLDSTLSREAVLQIFDRLAPSDKRGPLVMGAPFARLSIYGGGAVTTFLDYKNVSLDMSRSASSPGYVVAVITWKNRGCRTKPASR